MKSSGRSVSNPAHVRVGSGAHLFEVDATWARPPASHRWPEVVGVDFDSQGRVFVFARSAHPVMIFAPDGSFLDSWGAGQFVMPHGITIGPDDSVFLTDVSDHTVRKYTLDGKLQFSLGLSGQPSNTGVAGNDYRTIRRAAGPFNQPCNVAIGPEGEIYVADGYGNASVHRFSPEGQLRGSWGAPGHGPGQFNLPHGIAIDRSGNVWVADRENCRVQIFDPRGKFLGERRNLARPCQIAFDRDGNLLVAELGFFAAPWPGTPAPPAGSPGGRVTILDPQGALLARWGGGRDPLAPGDFFAPHDIRCDAQGNLYVGEVIATAGGNRGQVSLDCHSLQKFIRL